ncbi:dihydrodipicolinate synthase [Actinoplanes sp. SE50]|uniref:dihydrodipicolinate synthase family protein n=1 Tax=unclassified Actinoplanes TaxID=2626549 RepID=UPI00023ECEC9|nr:MULTISPECIES: dihydrodipicolinate synthase family protein [unclassified Actinoplanes]AEV85494.1 dihydrodipicolinate synthase [Actinoplanes sp. SE50/110]ATO83887.1 dihydrodipicolinate synthase [Actinoplanes sp. SE50]SLM01297.1 dihydrodipicolinate synthase family protein [Actinoplanes sp. SE50/110]
MFHGLSAFPLTPIADDRVDADAYTGLVARLAAARVDSITALGSTGSYPYLTRAERAATVRLAVAAAADIPVFAGIGALRTSQVLAAAADAQQAGAAAVLLAPMSYQPLTPDDVYGLFEAVVAELSVPLIVYDNPGTTHFTFTDQLYADIAALPRVASIKIPGPASAARVATLRGLLPPHVAIGISGDAHAAAGIGNGCDVWYSVLGGTLPRAAQSVLAGGSDRLAPLWDLFAAHGSLRVMAAIAEQLGLARRSCLPHPLRGLDDAARTRVAAVVDALDLAG